jgi:hypothetical protein
MHLEADDAVYLTGAWRLPLCRIMHLEADAQRLRRGTASADGKTDRRAEGTGAELRGAQTPTVPCIEQLLEERLRSAVALRAALGLPSPDTTVYRLCNRHGSLAGARLLSFHH